MYEKYNQDLVVKTIETKNDYVEISKINVRQEAVDLLEKEYAEKNGIFPIDCNEKIIVIATTDPMNYFLLDEIKIKTGKTARPVLSTADEIEKAIATFFTDKKTERNGSDLFCLVRVMG